MAKGSARFAEEYAKDAIDLIRGALDHFERAGQLEIGWSDHVDGAEGSIAAVRRHLTTVENGELRMAVVAPMSAGKSTLVNAITGYELLPARAAAMTTVPTRIVLEDLVDEETLRERGAEAFDPVLEIAEKELKEFQALLAALRGSLRGADLDAAYEHFPHLAELLGQITEGRVPPLRTRYRGREEVQGALMLVNDLVRLAGFHLPEGRLGALVEPPVVRTRYWSPEAVEATGPGRLVIVDTPGPDEHDLAELLRNTIKRQLSECHIVLVVLDYTKMGGSSDAMVRELMQPLLDAVGPGNLFAVVNKIDQRMKESDLSVEDAKRTAAHSLGISEAEIRDRVFTTAAHRALQGVKVMVDIKRSGSDLDVAGCESGKNLLQIVYPMTWEEELEDIDVDDLRRLAGRAWKRSGLPLLLTTAITTLRAQALPLAAKAALSVVASELSDLLTATAARRDLLGRESQGLVDEADRIAGEMAEVANFRRRVSAPADLIERLVRDLDTRLLKAREAGRKAIGKHFKDDNRIKKIATGLGLLKESDAIEFRTEEDAQHYMLRLTAPVQGKLAGILGNARTHVEDALGASAQRQMEAERAKIQPIVERAADRIKDKFDISFTLPGLELGETSTPEVVETPEMEVRYEKRKVERQFTRRSWRTLWLFKTTYTKTVTEVTKKQAYLVKPQKLAQSLEASFDEGIEEIRQALRRHAEEVMVDRVGQYYDEVEAFLQRYFTILEQSAKDNKLQEEAKEELRGTLEEFHMAVARHLEEVKEKLVL